MSGIAKVLATQGYRISGCDLDCEQTSVKDLKALGCTITEGNNTSACADPSIDVVVYSSAIVLHDPEIMHAQQRGIPTIPRALMLAELMRTKFSIAITGAHGKTTTTSLISHILIETHKDPTVIIGGHLKNISTNARYGAGDFLVAEADESDRSLLRLYPTFAVVTNIDLEHVDTYKDLDDIKQTFRQFLGNLPFYGKAIVCYDDQHIRSLVPELTHIKTIKYGLTPESDIYATDYHLEATHTTATVWVRQERCGTITLPMPGIHNLYNALAALAVAHELDIPFEQAANALAYFKGIERRFSFRGTFQGAQIFDDYGHHPTELKHTFAVARKRATKKLIGVFQPHRYTRTHGLWHEFVNVLSSSGCDTLIITDIYSAHEPVIPGITGEKLALEVQRAAPHIEVIYAPCEVDFALLTHQCAQKATEGDLILTLGAGKMNKLAEKLCSLSS